MTAATEKRNRKNNILTVMKKELRRFFGDRRMLMTILLPGILIYLIYSLMGDAMTSGILGGDETTDHRIGASHVSDTVNSCMTAIAEASGMTFGYDEHEDPIAAVKDGALDVYLDIPADFDEQVAAYDPAGGLLAPEVKIYYDSSSTSSQAAYSFLVAAFDAYESALANRFDINRDPSVAYDLAAPEDITGMLFSMIMPMLLIMLLFSGCMAMTTESIAGEKERGTIATLLVTPVKRSELAIGKIAALSIMSLLAGLCSAVGVILSLPKLMGGEDMGMVDASIYTIGDYGMILAVILSTILVFVSLIAVLSALANSVKEASSMISPLMILVTVIGVSGMFGGGAVAMPMYLVPVYNSVQCISGVFSHICTPTQIILTVVSNVVTAGVFVFVLTRLFNSERVMFKK